jgi:cob(I)alamin adenosyltransferase
VDEANCAIGVVVASGGIPDELLALLTRIQNDLFDVGADLCTPVVEAPEFAPLRVEQQYVDRLEAACDTYNEQLDALRSFVLPGGTVAASQLHVARTVVRRAERSTWAALAEHDDMSPLTATYLNRLSDLLFILSRVANLPAHGGSGDVLWKPGGDR